MIFGDLSGTKQNSFQISNFQIITSGINTPYSVSLPSELPTKNRLVRVSPSGLLEWVDYNSVSITQANHGFIDGTAIYFDGLDWQRAIATSKTTAATKIVTKVIDSHNFEVSSFYQNLYLPSHGLSNNIIYLSQTVAGQLTTVEPTTGIRQIVARHFDIDHFDVTIFPPTLLYEDIATEAEARTGVNNINWMSPLRTFQAIEEFLMLPEDKVIASYGSPTTVGFSQGKVIIKNTITEKRAWVNVPYLTKYINSAWQQGDEQGGAGVVFLANDTVFVFIISNGTNADILFDTSSVAANRPSGWDWVRMISVFKLNGSAQFYAFYQHKDGWIEADWSSQSYNITTSELDYSLIGCPEGIEVECEVLASSGIGLAYDIRAYRFYSPSISRSIPNASGAWQSIFNGDLFAYLEDSPRYVHETTVVSKSIFTDSGKVRARASGGSWLNSAHYPTFRLVKYKI